jgi:hypothetical protein
LHGREGYFRLEIHQLGDRLEPTADAVATKASMRIQVLDAKEKTLHTGKAPVTVVLGQVEFREIVLGQGDCGCPPSEPGPSTGVLAIQTTTAQSSGAPAGKRKKSAS